MSIAIREARSGTVLAQGEEGAEVIARGHSASVSLRVARPVRNAVAAELEFFWPRADS
jgi:hypothetical protein